MNKQPLSKEIKTGQPKPWSDAELRRIARVFELFIKIDRHQKKGRLNDGQ